MTSHATSAARGCAFISSTTLVELRAGPRQQGQADQSEQQEGEQLAPTPHAGEVAEHREQVLRAGRARPGRACVQGLKNEHR